MKLETPNEHERKSMTGHDSRSTQPPAQILDTLSLFNDYTKGGIAIDTEERITWINEKYLQLLSADVSLEEALGMPIRELVPETKMPDVMRTGKPILLDIIRFGNRHFVVCRLPTHDGEGKVSGAVGFVFFEEVEQLSPLLTKYRDLEKQLREKNSELWQMRRARYSLSSFLGTSNAVSKLRKKARMIATRQRPVLIYGETGVGKELLAHGIHIASSRSQKPFITVNAASFLEESFEAQFFGRYATDPGGQRKFIPGQLMMADRGTLFIDEVGDLPLSLQARFLRVIEDGVIETGEGEGLLHSDFRVIATTSRDLERCVQEGTFREDLFFRLAVLPINIPPLRSRIEDIDILVEFVLDRLRRDEGSFFLSNEAMLLLKAHTWPGNVREMINVIERASLEAQDEEIGAREVALALNTSADLSPHFDHETDWIPLSESVRRAERTAIIDALLRSRGNREESARLLGISRSNLYSKLKALGVDDL
ncbi:sigma-54 interaction domain-containing protein [Leisingera sp. D0M16]|uniref:sigma-54 interaction domain-containing protein n=1 Tax=Leisingera coralii TaxID=3351347 RepID=UPI003B7DC6D6